MKGGSMTCLKVRATAIAAKPLGYASTLTQEDYPYRLKILAGPGVETYDCHSPLEDALHTFPQYVAR
eukprot:740861-Amphidinium_carterae.1